ncbi:MAG: lysylphosphatidylglycerol synthase transmembrane domain-containing protein [Hyphomicrobiales bacterium]
MSTPTRRAPGPVPGPPPQERALPPGPRRRGWRSWRWWLQWGVTAGIIALIAWRMDLRAAWHVIRGLQPGWLVLGVALLIASNYVHAVKWQKLLQCVGHAPVVDLFAVFWSSMATNNVIPFRAGDVLRVQVLSRRTGLPRSGIVATLLTERILDGVSFVIILFAGFALMSGSGRELWLAGLVLGLVMVAALGATVLVARMETGRGLDQRRVLGRLPERLRRPLDAVLPDFVEGLRPLGSLQMGLDAGAWALAAWVLEALAYAAFGYAFGLDIAFGSYLLAMVAVNFAGSLTVLPSNLGIYEFAAIELLRATGATAGEATAYAFGSHLLVIVTISGVGLLTLAYLRIGLGEVLYLRERTPPADPEAPREPGEERRTSGGRVGER